MSTMEDKQVSTWRAVLAFILDFLTSFIVIGYIIAILLGEQLMQVLHSRAGRHSCFSQLSSCIS